MQDVPGMDTVDIVRDSRAGVGASQARDEGSDDILGGGGSQLFWNALLVTIDMIDQDPSAVRLASGGGPCIGHDIEDLTELVLLGCGMAAGD